MSIARRDLFKLLGGSAAGLALTPVPWKLIDDVSIWSQNWSWIPKPPRGEIKTRYTTCSLCQAACGVRARCVGKQPVSLAGIQGHPNSDGVLCPAGLAGHHIPYHPLRIKQHLKAGKPLPPADCVRELAARLSAPGEPNSIAILDGEPQAATSAFFQNFAAAIPSGGLYLTANRSECATLDALRSLAETELGGLGVDFENVRSVLSFGAPVYESWGPAKLMRRNGRLRVIQVEPVESQTACAADLWVPVKPGTEAAFALGLAHVITREKLLDEAAVRRSTADFPEYFAFLSSYTPEWTAEATGIGTETLRRVAREITASKPAVAVGFGRLGAADAQIAIAGLNLLLGSVGESGGMVAKRTVLESATLPAARSLDSVPDGSLRVLIVTGESEISWEMARRKLVAKNPTVISLSAFPNDVPPGAGVVEYAIPAPVYLESSRDATGPFEDAAASFSLSPALLEQPSYAIEPAAFLAKTVEAGGFTIPGESSVDALRNARVEAIFRSGKGKLFQYSDGATVELSKFASADDLAKAFDEGACWFEQAASGVPKSRFTFLGKDRRFAATLERAAATQSVNVAGEDYPLVLVPSRGSCSTCESPILSKLYQESDLKARPGTGLVHPDTGREFGLRDGCTMHVASLKGSCIINSRFDPGVMPGTLQVALDPAQADGNGRVQTKTIREICAADAECMPGTTRVKVWKA